MQNEGRIVLAPMVYCGSHSDGKPVLLYVDLANKHTDPFGMLLWGYIAGTGEPQLGDYRKFYTRPTVSTPNGTKPAPSVFLYFFPHGELLTEAEKNRQRAKYIQEWVKNVPSRIIQAMLASI